MPRTLAIALALATLSGTAAMNAQVTDPADQGATQTINNNQRQPMQTAQNGPQYQTAPQVNTSEAMPGVWVRSTSASVVNTGSTANGANIRVEHGVVNVQVQHPTEHASILVDLPRGQVALLKNGLYTFNGDTNTVRVLRGEAEATTTGNTNAKPVKVKEDHEYSFNGPKAFGVDDPRELTADLLPMGQRDGSGYAGGGAGYGYAPYGDGIEYPYAAYGWGYPYAYGWGYPYGFYPYGGFGLGFGYYGGFRGGYGGYGRGGYVHGGGRR